MSIWTMAWRNVWRNKRRSFVTIAAMTFSLWVLLLYSGLISGFMGDMASSILDLELGDIQIHAPGYTDTPSVYDFIEGSEALLARLDQAGYRASARLLNGGLAASGEMSAGVAFTGLDPKRDARVSLIHERMDRGQWLSTEDPKGVVLGSALARVLDVQPGGELLVLSQALDGSVANELFRVRGILNSVASGTDRSMVFMTTEAFRGLFAFPKGAHRITVRLDPEQDLLSSAVAIAELAGEQDTQTWRELVPVIAMMLDSAEAQVYVLFFVVYLAIGILILNAMLMAVFERIKEFGVFKALGMTPSQVLGLILLEAGVQISMALVLGLALAAPGMWFLQTRGIDVGSMSGMAMAGISMPSIWRGLYTLKSILGPVLMLIFMAGTATLYPALKAAWIRPIDSMRHQ